MPKGRILLAAELWHGSAGASLAAGLRGDGWVVTEVDLFHHFSRSTSRSVRALQRLTRPLSIASYNRAIVEASRLARFDALLTVKGSYIASQTLAMLRAGGTLAVNFYPDVEFGHAGMNVGRLRDYDVIASTKEFHGDFLERELGPGRHVHISHGYAPEVHRDLSPSDETGYATDIGFIGNFSPYKRDFLLPLATAVPADVRFAVIGNGWQEGAAETQLAPHIVGHGVTGDLYAQAIATTRINVALHHGPVVTPGWQDTVSTRSFEIPACGGFMLHIDNAQIRALYAVGQEIDVFATPDELATASLRLLDQPERRAAMARAAHSRAVPAYSYHTRARELGKLIAERRVSDLG